MMFDTDFSRLKEILYPEISGDVQGDEISVFMERAMTEYHQKFMKGKLSSLSKKISFCSNELHLNFYLFGDSGKIYLNRIDMAGYLKDLSITGSMWGIVDAYFSNLNLGRIPEPSKSDIIYYKRKNICKMGIFELLLVRDNIVKISLRPGRKIEEQDRHIQKYLNVDSSIKSYLSTSQYILFKQVLYDFLNEADKITIRNYAHPENDPNRVMTSIKTEIIRNNDKHYMKYSMRSPIENRELDIDMIKQCLKTYEHIRHNFSCLKNV